MKLYTASRAPNPRRVQMFMHEKGIPPMELIAVDINAGEHRGEAYRAKVPVSRVPALELDDGRILSETRAICTYLEGICPENNLMGVDFEERAFIESCERGFHSAPDWLSRSRTFLPARPHRPRGSARDRPCRWRWRCGSN